MKKVLIFCLLCSSIFGGTIRLLNNSSYKLKAVIHGADGTCLGEMIVFPQHLNTWSDGYTLANPGSSQKHRPNPNQTLTPYTVRWSCMNGDLFSVCTNVPVGGMVTAEGCNGPKYCKPPPKKNSSASSPIDLGKNK